MAQGPSGEARSSRGGRLLLAGLLAGATTWALWPRGEDEPAPADDAAPPASAALPSATPRATAGAAPDLRLLERAAISGVVRDPQGRGVASAQVCATGQSRLLDPADLLQPACTTAGRDGRYRLENLWGVAYVVSASAPRYIPGFYRREGGANYERVRLRPGAEAQNIDITLQDGAVELRGAVKDLSGGAIEGALVRAGGVFFGTGMTYASSGAEGEFSLWVRPGPLQVFAQAEGYAPGSDSGSAPGHAFEVFMTPEAVLVGKVVRAGDGSPVAGAHVSIERGDGFGGEGNGARTDEAGNFRIDRLTPGAYKPSAASDDAYGVAAEQVLLGLGETSAPIVIEAHPAYFVEGVVVVAGGDACESGGVSLRDDAQEREYGAMLEADGVAHLAGVLPGTYAVSVRCEGYVAAERYEPVVIADASASGLRWEVTPGQQIRGVVVTAKGEPAAGLNVSARPKSDPAQPRARAAGSYGQTTDAQGRFALAGLLPGSYEVSVYTVNSPRATPQEPREVTLPEGQDLEDLRIELPAVGQVRGQVRDAQGKGVARARVRLVASGRRTPAITTADDGSFHLPEVEPGEYRAVASRDDVTLRAPGTGDDDVQGVRLTVRADAVETVTLTVESGSGKISGVVRDAGGGPLTDAFVEATRESESAAAGSGPNRRAWFSHNDRPILTDADGRFVADSLLPGKYSVRAFRRGGGEATAEHVALGSDLVLTIAETGRLAGTVALEGGGAPQEFTASVEDAKTGYRRSDTFFRTGGAWSFAELPQGDYKLSVSAPEGTRTLDVSLASGEERSGLRVELAGKVTVRGTVVDLEGAPIPGVEVRISSGRSFRFGGDEGDNKHVSDAAGRFEVARAPVGAVRIDVSPGRGGPEAYGRANFAAQIEAGGAVVELPPIRLAKRQVERGDAVGDLGLSLRPADPGADPMQAKHVVALVRPGGPAAAAGLQVGDEIVRVGGQDVTGVNAYLYRALTQVPVGAVVRLEVARGATLELTAAAPP